MNRKLIGGNEITPMKQIEIFMSIVILGYFGIKIVYGLFFHFYPDKYYFRNIDLSLKNTTANCQKKDIEENIALHAYVPGLWNNEITDFVIAVILSFIVYIYTYSFVKNSIQESGNVEMIFLIGYILGLGYPVIYEHFFKHSTSTGSRFFELCTRYLSYIALLVLIVTLIILQISSTEGSTRSNYTIYAMVLILLLVGLIVSKKK